MVGWHIEEMDGKLGTLIGEVSRLSWVFVGDNWLWIGDW